MNWFLLLVLEWSSLLVPYILLIAYLNSIRIIHDKGTLIMVRENPLKSLVKRAWLLHVFVQVSEWFNLTACRGAVGANHTPLTQPDGKVAAPKCGGCCIISMTGHFCFISGVGSSKCKNHLQTWCNWTNNFPEVCIIVQVCLLEDWQWMSTTESIKISSTLLAFHHLIPNSWPPGGEWTAVKSVVDIYWQPQKRL